MQVKSSASELDSSMRLAFLHFSGLERSPRLNACQLIWLTSALVQHFSSVPQPLHALLTEWDLHRYRVGSTGVGRNMTQLGDFRGIEGKDQTVLAAVHPCGGLRGGGVGECNVDKTSSK